MLDEYRKAFYFDGVCSKDLGLYISGDKTYNSPEKKYDKVSIPGRSGDLLLSDGSYKNFKVSYDSFVVYNLDHKIRDLRSFLLSKDGYRRLEDDYHPHEFKMAAFSGPLNFDVILLTAGKVTLEFDCKPQRYLKQGELPIDVTSNRVIFNPTYCTAKPLITVTGTGSFTIGGRTVTVTESGITIDTDIEQAYNGSTYKNDKITVTNNLFPVLEPGENEITLSGVTLSITPRWYTL